MFGKFFRPVLFALAIVCLCGTLSAVDRTKVADHEKWNLTDLFASDEAWAEAKTKLEARFPEVDPYKGTLGKSAKNLLDCMSLLTELQKDFYRLGSYASMNSDLDMRNAAAMGMKQSLGPMGSAFGARVAWVDPEILEIPEKTLADFFKTEPGLEVYKPVIDDIIRTKAHTLSEKEEKLMADAGLMRGTGGAAYGIFANADLIRATVTLTDGEKVYLDAPAYTVYRAAPNRWDRERVFAAFFGNLNDYRGTYGALLNGHVKTHFFTKKARNYSSCLAASLDGPNIPTAVYHNLIKNVHKNLPTLWRYLKLRQRIMGLGQLRYSDLYASIIKEVDLKYTTEEAQHAVLKAVAPLGDDYVEILANGFKSRWVDWYPSPGKRSGAYSNGSDYDGHPFVLMNFTGTHEEVSTLAHEMGHAMHSYSSNHTQPFPTSHYTTFVAEVASTCNEHLLMDYMLKKTDDDQVKLFLLGNYIDNIRQTLFRQTQFAEFELRIHEMVEKGVALTGDVLNDTYKEIIDAYYGAAEGVTEINPECYVEWAYIPHFYYNFYVYSYSTSITASTAISQMILDGKPGAVDNYRRFLSLGDSMPPVDELKVAGVDMTTDQPFTVTMKAMNKAMDEIEAILDRMEK